MTQKEQITSFIEEYLEKFVKDEIELTVGEIRKWPVIDKICENQNSANICKAMNAVKYEHTYISGIEDSTTYKMLYKPNPAIPKP